MPRASCPAASSLAACLLHAVAAASALPRRAAVLAEPEPPPAPGVGAARPPLTLLQAALQCALSERLDWHAEVTVVEGGSATVRLAIVLPEAVWHPSYRWKESPAAALLFQHLVPALPCAGGAGGAGSYLQRLRRELAQLRRPLAGADAFRCAGAHCRASPAIDAPLPSFRPCCRSRPANPRCASLIPSPAPQPGGLLPGAADEGRPGGRRDAHAGCGCGAALPPGAGASHAFVDCCGRLLCRCQHHTRPCRLPEIPPLHPLPCCQPPRSTRR